MNVLPVSCFSLPLDMAKCGSLVEIVFLASFAEGESGYFVAKGEGTGIHFSATGASWCAGEELLKSIGLSGCFGSIWSRSQTVKTKLARESPVIPWKSTIHIANSCSSSNGGSNDAHSRVTKLHVNNIWLHVGNYSAYQAEQKSLTTLLPVCSIYFKVLVCALLSKRGAGLKCTFWTQTEISTACRHSSAHARSVMLRRPSALINNEPR